MIIFIIIDNLDYIINIINQFNKVVYMNIKKYKNAIKDDYLLINYFCPSINPTQKGLLMILGKNKNMKISIKWLITTLIVILISLFFIITFFDASRKFLIETEQIHMDIIIMLVILFLFLMIIIFLIKSVYCNVKTVNALKNNDLFNALKYNVKYGNTLSSYIYTAFMLFIIGVLYYNSNNFLNSILISLGVSVFGILIGFMYFVIKCKYLLVTKNASIYDPTKITWSKLISIVILIIFLSFIQFIDHGNIILLIFFQISMFARSGYSIPRWNLVISLLKNSNYAYDGYNYLVK